MNNYNNKIWSKSNKNIMIDEDKISCKGFIYIKSNNYKKIKSYFILKFNKLYLLENDKVKYYINLFYINIKYDETNIIIKLSNKIKYFNLYFDNYFIFLKWKKQFKLNMLQNNFQQNFKIIKFICKFKNYKLYTGENKITGIMHHIKSYNNIDIDLKDIKNELKIMKNLKKNKNILSLEEIFKSKNEYYFIYEYTNLINLTPEFFNKNLSINNIEKIINDINCGLSHIHSNNIIHQNLNLESIYLHIDTNNIITAKIGNFNKSIILKNKLMDNQFNWDSKVNFDLFLLGHLIFKINCLYNECNIFLNKKLYFMEINDKNYYENYDNFIEIIKKSWNMVNNKNNYIINFLYYFN